MYNRIRLTSEFYPHAGEKSKWGALDKLPGEILLNNPSLGLTKYQIAKYLKHYVRIGGGYGRWRALW
jgi:hypothetical protein